MHALGDRTPRGSQLIDSAAHGKGWSHSFRPGAKGTAEFTEKNVRRENIFRRLCFFQGYARLKPATFADSAHRGRLRGQARLSRLSQRQKGERRIRFSTGRLVFSRADERYLAVLRA